jgi:two-component system OmpR family response regulator
VDDDLELIDLLSYALRRAGFDVLAAHDADTGVALLKQSPDLAVVDLNLGARDGFELLRDLRDRTRIPVLILSARSAEDDTVRALELGADDYVTKPFSHRELIARITANLRRASQHWAAPNSEEALLQVGPISLDRAQHTVAVDGTPVELTVTEFRLLHYLAVNAGHVVPAPAILEHVWGYNDDAASDVLRTTISRLRRKLGDSSDERRLIHTRHGVGFMLNPIGSSATP